VACCVLISVSQGANKPQRDFRGLANQLVYLDNILRELDIKEGGLYSDEQAARAWVDAYEEGLRRHKNAEGLAEWVYETNITDYNSQMMQEASVASMTWMQPQLEEAQQYYKYSKLFSDPQLTRELQLIVENSLPSPKDEKDKERLSTITSEMATIYSTATVEHDGEKYLLEPGLMDILTSSKDYDELVWVWKGFRDAAGIPQRELYEEYVQLSNKAAQQFGHANMGEAWQKNCYEETDMEEFADEIWQDIQPLYAELHAYVRRKLAALYPGKWQNQETGPIPAHIFGNMWAQEWDYLLDDVLPYPNVTTPDATQEMRKQAYTPLDMFQLAEDYFVNIGLSPMTDTFWEKSMIQKPEGRDVVCHGSAHDLSSPGDFRIKMCTEIDSHYLKTVHHEMGHIEYFMQYAHQPSIEREGANCAFHEAVGDTIALMVATPEHLKKVGLYSDDQQSSHSADRTEEYQLATERDINFLMRLALEKLPVLPWALVVEKWRYGVFRGDITPQNYNQAWWQLREAYQGVQAPVERTEEDFDPGAKYHIPADVPYMRYFLSFVVQFQFHRALCDTADIADPIHHCDIYDTQKAQVAGHKLRSMLAMGRSQPWRDALEVLTGEREFKASALIRFFAPLQEWLKRDNEAHGQTPGWT